MLKKSLSLIAILAAGVSAAHAETRISATGDQAELCNVEGIKVLHSGNGYSVESFAARNTTPSIVVSLNGKQCYFDLVEGEGSGFNVKYNGVTYHTQRPRYVPKFFFTPGTDGDSYAFQISAAGTYDIDWGDGTVQRLDKTSVGLETVSHKYDDASANTHEITLGGRATGYSTSNAAIRFYDGLLTSDNTSTYQNPYELKSMRGCLGCVFSTLSNDGQPLFSASFIANKQLTKIPDELFDGVVGAPVKSMFARTFERCVLLSEIPEDLFSGIKGAPADSVFQGTFSQIPALTQVPENLFSGIQGKPAPHMFRSLFHGCSGLKNIPENLFSGIKGAPAAQMFASFCQVCTGLTSIPEGLFAGITPTGDYIDHMFYQAFRGAKGITGGTSPKIDGRYLYEIWSPTTREYVFENNTGLTDYNDIPENWR